MFQLLGISRSLLLRRLLPSRLGDVKKSMYLRVFNEYLGIAFIHLHDCRCARNPECREDMGQFPARDNVTSLLPVPFDPCLCILQHFVGPHIPLRVVKDSKRRLLLFADYLIDKTLVFTCQNFQRSHRSLPEQGFQGQPQKNLPQQPQLLRE